jgi:hypothetical protein
MSNRTLLYEITFVRSDNTQGLKSFSSSSEAYQFAREYEDGRWDQYKIHRTVFDSNTDIEINSRLEYEWANIDLSKAKEHQLIAELRNRGNHVIIWCAEDVKHHAEDLEIEVTDDEAQYIVDMLESNHDCNHGTTWDSIACHLYDLETEKA